MEGIYETVNGVLLPKLSPKRWEYLRTYPLRPDDVFIVTYPKGGTTWTQQIVRLLRNNGRVDNQLLDRAVPWLEVLDSDFGIHFDYNVAMETILSPRAFKSHFPYHLIPGGMPHTSPAKYIYVARNPKDNIVSLWHHRKRLQCSAKEHSWDGFLFNALCGKRLFGSWFDRVLEWWNHKDEENILFLKYEDMKKDPYQSVRTIANFIGVTGATDELIVDVVKKSSFSSMSQDPTTDYSWQVGTVYATEGVFMRKGVIGDWKNTFTSEQNTSFDKMYHEKMAGTGLNFDFE